MKQTWGKLGGQLGLACVGLGLLVIGIGWNGAASIDFVSGQVPYLLSGGFLGLALVGTGIGLLVVQNSRKDRAIIEAQLKELADAVARLGNALGAGGATNGSARTAAAGAGAGPVLAEGMVLIGASSYHRPDCKLAAGKPLAALPIEAAQSEGLSPCRICNPDALEPVPVASAAVAASAEPTPGEDRSARRPRRRTTARPS